MAELVPRTKRELCCPMPPFCAMSTPGRRRITSVREVDCQRSISCRVTTLTGASTVSIGCATRFAVTTNVFELLVLRPAENAVTG